MWSFVNGFSDHGFHKAACHLKIPVNSQHYETFTGVYCDFDYVKHWQITTRVLSSALPDQEVFGLSSVLQFLCLVCVLLLFWCLVHIPLQFRCLVNISFAFSWQSVGTLA